MTRLLAFSHIAFGLRHKHRSHEPQTSNKVTYISNLEGDLDQLVLSLETSEMDVTWHADHALESPCPDLENKDDFLKEVKASKKSYSQLACWPKLSLPTVKHQFVFGGNLFDHGMGDIRLANMFIKLYQECIEAKRCDPKDEDEGKDTLYYILGNRDILKMRYALKTQTDLEAVTWNRNPINMKKKEGESLEVSLRKEQLKETSGARESFNFRREEIKLLELDDDNNVTDEEVADSFQWMTGVNAPSEGKAAPMAGLYKEYLKYADLIVKIDSTIYSHGAITQENFMQGMMKGKYSGIYFEPAPLATVNGWIKSLRDLDDNMIKLWAKAIDENQFDENNFNYPGLKLLKYMMAFFSKGSTVVESSIMKEFEMNQDKIDEVAKKLKENGIKRCVGGFRTPGATPTVARSRDDKVEFVNANMNFDSVCWQDHNQAGRMSRRNGWARIEIENDEAKKIGKLPNNFEEKQKDYDIEANERLKSNPKKNPDNNCPEADKKSK